MGGKVDGEAGFASAGGAHDDNDVVVVVEVVAAGDGVEPHGFWVLG